MFKDSTTDPRYRETEEGQYEAVSIGGVTPWPPVYVPSPAAWVMPDGVRVAIRSHSRELPLQLVERFGVERVRWSPEVGVYIVDLRHRRDIRTTSIIAMILKKCEPAFQVRVDKQGSAL